MMNEAHLKLRNLVMTVEYFPEIKFPVVAQSLQVLSFPETPTIRLHGELANQLYELSILDTS